MLAELDNDPWGTPYKRVMRRLSRSTPSVTETIPGDRLLLVLGDLFLDQRTERSDERVVIDNVPDITVNELKRCFVSAKKRRTAPSLDGLFKTLWTQAPEVVVRYLLSLFMQCLRSGRIPSSWKYVRLVLIAKSPGQPDTKYKPICLINDVAKGFERLLVSRIWSILEEQRGDGLSSVQFGFRRGYSTVDALQYMDSYVRAQKWVDKYVVAVSLDIRNAFNSLPWNTILSELSKWNLPEYIMQILRDYLQDYLQDRWIIYKDSSSHVQRYPVRAGMPQSSVLGPILWLLSYNSVLNMPLPYNATLVGYADDTLILVSGSNVEETVRRAQLCAGLIADQIKSLGLELAVVKTDALLIGGHRIRRDLTLELLGKEVEVKTQIKYLGVILDRNMRYKEHFAYVTDKAECIVRRLCCLMPNLRGPGEAKRRFYVHMINSVLLYASPVWSVFLSRFHTYQYRFRRVQRLMALRVISAYRTLSYEAATLLAVVPPVHLLAARNRRMYVRLHELSTEERSLNPAFKKNIKEEETIALHRQWNISLDTDGLPGRLTRMAVLPYFEDWLNRYAGLSFYMTQMLTGHGSFGKYLFWINKAETDQCFYCGYPMETPIHAYEECGRWNVERRKLELFLEESIRWIRIVYWFLFSKETTDRVCSFIIYIMRTKFSDELRIQSGEVEIAELRFLNDAHLSSEDSISMDSL